MVELLEVALALGGQDTERDEQDRGDEGGAADDPGARRRVLHQRVSEAPRREREQDQAGQHEAQERPEEERGEQRRDGRAGKAPVDPPSRTPGRGERPVEVRGHLDDPRVEHAGLGDDLGVDVGVGRRAGRGCG